MAYILAIDQGTTSSRSILFDHSGAILHSSQQDFEQIFPKPGWVEHDPEAIWKSQHKTMKSVIRELKSPDEVLAIGITNQRETTIVWNKETGEPIYNAIVWQDRRTASFCNALVESRKSELIRSKTGLVIDAYFSGSKIAWILDNVEGARDLASEGKLCFGTVDSWLIYKLTDGRLHITDVTNACRTMLFNIHELNWDKELLELFNIPESMLPEVVESSSVYGHTSNELFGSELPIAGIAGDQQAALFGQMCVDIGMAKNTYGTGCFLLMNTGGTPIGSKNNLLTTVAWTINGQTTYALEGSVFVGGAVVQWIRDGLNLIDDAKEIEELAASVSDNGGLVFVPALTGMGAPYWDPYAQGSIFGISRGTTKSHLARAALEGIAFQVYDLIKAMEEDSGKKCTELRVDGGASANDLLMQFQADLFQFEVIRSKIQETTALGAAYLAGLAVGYWTGIDELKSQWAVGKSFSPELDSEEIERLLGFWKKGVNRAQSWLED